MESGQKRILQNVNKHIKLGRAEQEYFLSILKFKSIKKHEHLLLPGEVCKHESFILKGCLRTYHVDGNGYEHTVVFSIEDWWASDRYSFFSGLPSQLNIEAVEDTDMFQIQKRDLEQLFISIPKFERFFRIVFQNAYVSQQQRILESMSLPAHERYNQFLIRYPKLHNRLTQKLVASFLGITPEFLSMIRNELARKSIS